MRKIHTTDLDKNVQSNEQVFEGEYDEEGVFVYQAFRHTIADYAIMNQRFGGEDFNPSRMTWIKPSFAWMLYRSGYGHKHHQERVLKIKLPHHAMGKILEECVCKHGGGGSVGRVQWDPARDLYTCEGRKPRKMLRKRAIQIGMKGLLSRYYVASVISIEDVTDLAHDVGAAHVEIGKRSHSKRKPKASVPESTHFNDRLTTTTLSEHLVNSYRLPHEVPYLPLCSPSHLQKLGMIPGDTAEAIAAIGRGLVAVKR